MTRPATLDEARARLRRLDGGLRLDTERAPPGWTAYGYGVGRGDGETWEAAWDAMVDHARAVWEVLHDAPEPHAEVEALRRQVAELTENGVSLHKASAEGYAIGEASERCAVVAHLRHLASRVPDHSFVYRDAVLSAANLIERGAHR